MRLEGTVHCDGPDCEHSAHVNVIAMEQQRLPNFLRLIEYGDRDHHLAFCSYDCVMKWCAQKPPTEVIPFGSTPEGNE